MKDKVSLVCPKNGKSCVLSFDSYGQAGKSFGGTGRRPGLIHGCSGGCKGNDILKCDAVKGWQDGFVEK